MTLRTEAGDSVIGMMREWLREPTGSPVARELSTIWRKISRERSLSWARLISLEPIGTSCDTERMIESMPRRASFVYPGRRDRQHAGLWSEPCELKSVAPEQRGIRPAARRM